MRAAFALVLLLVAAGAAEARMEPALYYLRDDVAPPLPGVLSAEPPDDLDPSGRPVLPGTEEVPTALFLTPPGEHPGLLRGRAIVALWSAPSPVAEGTNLTAVLYSVGANGSLTAAAAASVDAYWDPGDPARFVPPDPTDPEGAAAHVEAEALKAAMRAPMWLDLGFVEAEVDPDGAAAIGFYLDGDPVGLGALGLLYDGQLHPSFVYLTWFSPQPAPAPARTITPAPPAPPEPTPPPTPEPVVEGDGRGAPAVALLFVAFAVAFAARRPQAQPAASACRCIRCSHGEGSCAGAMR